MKILMYEPLVTPESKGYLIHVQELAHNLARLGHEVVLIAQLSTWPYGTRVRLRRVRKPGNTPIASYLLLALAALFSAIKVSVRWRPEVIYTRHGLLGDLLLRMILKCSLVVEVNGLLRDELRQIYSKRSSLPLSRRIFLRTVDREISHSDHIVAVTSGIERALETELGVGPERIAVIPNGTNTDLFRPLDGDEARAELQLSATHRYICFVGSLEGWQGVEYLIRSMPRVLDECPNACILIVGDGPTRADLVALARELGVLDKTLLAGNVAYEKVPLYINASDICVAPFVRARNERIGLSPLKLYDYLACGKPVVGSDIPGVADTLKAANAGITAIPEDPESLAEAILGLLGNDALRKQMGENGRKYAVENHSWRSVAERVAQVCEQVIAARHRRPGPEQELPRSVHQ